MLANCRLAELQLQGSKREWKLYIMPCLAHSAPKLPAEKQAVSAAGSVTIRANMVCPIPC